MGKIPWYNHLNGTPAAPRSTGPFGAALGSGAGREARGCHPAAGRRMCFFIFGFYE